MVLRHINCLDMDLLVLKVYHGAPGRLNLKVKYINRKGRLLHPDTESVVILKCDLWKWSRV